MDVGTTSVTKNCSCRGEVDECKPLMDGRVGAIRQALDAEGFTHVSIMSYTAK